MSTSRGPTTEELTSLLNRAAPRMRDLLTVYAISEAGAELMIQETVLALMYKWDQISNREEWLLRTLERRCRRLMPNDSPPDAPATGEADPSEER